MERRLFGPTKQQVPVIGQGTWYAESDDRSSAIAALPPGHRSRHDPCRHRGDVWFGQSRRDGRRGDCREADQVFLVSKVLPENASRRGTIAACERSLDRLQTDRLDCYLLHWRGRYALKETISAFEQLNREGKVLSWGVSNFDVPDLEEAREIVGAAARLQSGPLSPEERAIEHAVIPGCETHGVAVVGYSPFGRRELSPSSTSGGRVLEEIADNHAATPHQVALRFLVRYPPVFTIPKATNPEHAAENAGAGDLHLSEAELALIDQTFPLGPRPRVLPTL